MTINELDLGQEINFGKYKHNNSESSIKWIKVSHDNTFLCISKIIRSCFNEELPNSNETTNIFSESNIFKYLNKEFIENYFTEKELELICDSTITHAINKSPKEKTETITCKVYLPSQYEITGRHPHNIREGNTPWSITSTCSSIIRRKFSSTTIPLRTSAYGTTTQVCAYYNKNIDKMHTHTYLYFYPVIKLRSDLFVSDIYSHEKGFIVSDTEFKEENLTYEEWLNTLLTLS